LQGAACGQKQAHHFLSAYFGTVHGMGHCNNLSEERRGLSRTGHVPGTVYAKVDAGS